MSATQRTYLYGVAIALVPILVSFGLLTEDRAPLVLSLVAAILSAVPPAVALRHVTPDDPSEDGGA